MRKLSIFGTLIVAGFFLLMLAQPAVAPLVNTNSMNARFTHWQENSHVIHIFIFTDAGRPSQPAAQVSVGQPVLFGFEWSGTGGTVAALQASIIDNALHDILLSVDGASLFSVKTSYQNAFSAATESGPAWTWDHDGDGAGDGDNDGLGDWSGPILFFRYQSAGLTAGTHTFLFCVTVDGGATFGCEPITVVAS